jgi:hypothetical protein
MEQDFRNRNHRPLALVSESSKAAEDNGPAARSRRHRHSRCPLSSPAPTKRKLAKPPSCPERRDRMKTWAILAFALGLQISSRATEENVRTFRAIDPDQLDAKVPHGFGKVFVEAGRRNSIDPLILAAISAHESGGWKSRAARLKNNWMGLVARSGPKRFTTPEASIFYAAELLNRQPFTGHFSLASIAPLYCSTNPTNWRKSVHLWSLRLMPR